MKAKNTLFFGNGLNYGESKSWNQILQSVAKDCQLGDTFDLTTTKLTTFYEAIIMNSKKNDSDLNDEENIKNKIATEMKNMNPTDNIKLVSKYKFDNFITTNYDSALKNVFRDCGYIINENKKISNEKIYSVRRFVDVCDKDKSLCRIWNIHGEISNPKTIMLGLDHYCGYIGKIDSYIKGNYQWNENIESIKKKLSDGESFDNYSWIELFFNTDVHIIGFGLDYSEIDIWWLLNKRARLMKELKGKINNRITYYGEVDAEKELYLKSFNVEVVIMKEKNYNEFYSKCLEDIELDKKNKKDAVASA